LFDNGTGRGPKGVAGVVADVGGVAAVFKRSDGISADCPGAGDVFVWVCKLVMVYAGLISQTDDDDKENRDNNTENVYRQDKKKKI